MPGTVDEELGGRLFEIMIRNVCHAAVIGPSGSVKSVAVKSALKNLPSRYLAIVLDTHGEYGGYTDYHAPYPINIVEAQPPESIVSMVEESIRLVEPGFKLHPDAAWLIEEVARLMRGEEDVSRQLPRIDVGSHPRSLEGVGRAIAKMIEGRLLSRDLVEPAEEAYVALSRLNHWMFNTTHPLIERLLRGELRGRSIGIDLSVLEEPWQFWLYVIALMRTIEDRGLEDVVLVIDEAFVDNGLPGEIGDWVEAGADRGRYVVLVANDLPNDIFFRVVVKFPYMFRGFEDVLARRVDPDLVELGRYGPYAAKLHVFTWTEDAEEWLGRGHVEVPVKFEKPEPKPSAVTLTKCVEEVAGENAKEVIDDIRRGGFEGSKYAKEAKLTWECIGR
jgi:hypothetical protein